VPPVCQWFAQLWGVAGTQRFFAEAEISILYRINQVKSPLRGRTARRFFSGAGLGQVGAKSRFSCGAFLKTLYYIFLEGSDRARAS